MKIYFTYSHTLPIEKVELVQSILSSTENKVQIKKRPGAYDQVDLTEAEKLYRDNLKQIKSADIVISEISFYSGATGYEISLALENKKPVIALYNMKDYKDIPGSLKSVPITMKGNTSKYLLLKEYDLGNLKRILELAINDAKSLVDTKFILIIPPHIDRYLEWNVKEKGRPKAEITREAIDFMMKQDTKYQEYLKDAGISE